VIVTYTEALLLVGGGLIALALWCAVLAAWLDARTAARLRRHHAAVLVAIGDRDAILTAARATADATAIMGRIGELFGLVEQLPDRKGCP